MKYALLQAPMKEGEYRSQIEIIDNSTFIGKGRVEVLCEDGWTHVGWIESELKPSRLQAGLEYYAQKHIDEAREKISMISDMLTDVSKNLY